MKLNLAAARRLCCSFAVTGLLTGLGSTSGPAVAATTIAKTIPISASTRVEIANVFGDVEIHGWNREEVRLEGALGDKSTLDAAQAGNTLTIKAKPPQGESDQQPENTHLVVYVPRAASVTASSVIAAVSASGLQGPLAVSSSTGPISLDVASQTVDVRSISGTIVVSDATKGAKITISDNAGAVKAAGINGELSFNGIIGSLDLGRCAPTRLDLHSTSGTIAVRCSVVREAKYRIVSLYGHVGFHSVSPPNARFEVHTRYGSIQNAFDPLQSSSGGPSGHASHFTVGRGDADVTLETESGSIVLD